MSESTYKATHTDPITKQLRDAGWLPVGYYKCGCNAGSLCAQHATIRAAEHYHPELAR